MQHQQDRPGSAHPTTREADITRWLLFTLAAVVTAGAAGLALAEYHRDARTFSAFSAFCLLAVATVWLLWASVSRGR
jgi:hypothetical protein